MTQTTQSRASLGKKASLALLLWVLFSLCCIALLFVIPVLAVFVKFYPKNSYPRRLVRAANKLVAVLLGFSGRFTVSVECTDSPKYRWLHDSLDVIEEKHCENEVFAQGAYCRLSDHQRGDK